MVQWRSRLLMVLAATLCMAGTGAAQGRERQMGGVGITVYDDINYRGDNATFRSDQPDLGRAGFAHRISSLQVAPGEIWEACQGANFRPPCQVFSGAEPDLRRRNWTDRISSLRRVRGNGGGDDFPNRPGGRGLVIYSDERFRGKSRAINGPTSSLGSFNDDAESVRVSGVWELCEDIDFGKCRTVDRDIPNLASIGLSKRLSSARPVLNGRGGNPGPFPPPSQSMRLVLYERDRYRGSSRTLDSASGGLGGFGNQVQSVRVVGTWELCDGPNFSGRCVTVSRDVPDLASYRLNDRVSSARPVGGRPR